MMSRSSIITENLAPEVDMSVVLHDPEAADGPKLPPTHPGTILLEEFLEPHGLSQYRLARSISVPPRRINEIVLGKRAVSADTALRLARFFGNSAQFWMNLQIIYDLETELDRLGQRLEDEVTPREALAG